MHRKYKVKVSDIIMWIVFVVAFVINLLERNWIAAFLVVLAGFWFTMNVSQEKLLKMYGDLSDNQMELIEDLAKTNKELADKLLDYEIEKLTKNKERGQTCQ